MIDKVIKFGGTSVGSEAGLRRVLAIVAMEKAEKRSVAIVVSAFSKVTDQLLYLAFETARNINYNNQLALLIERHLAIVKNFFLAANRKKLESKLTKICRELQDVLLRVRKKKRADNKDLDLIASFGERLSAVIITEILNIHGIKSVYVDARKLIKTDSQFTKAKVSWRATERNIQKYWKTIKGVPVITGFIASDFKNQTTTMGRGTSDYTAALLGAGLSAKAVEIWTDVDGVFAKDPKKNKRQTLIKHLTYKQAEKMAKAGAKLVHPLTMPPLEKKTIPVIIKNTYNFQSPGTIISG